MAGPRFAHVYQLPYTIASCAVSLDGYLDDTSPERLILSGPQDLDEVDELRAQADAILVGAGTVRADNPRLLVRDPARVAARVAAGRPPHPLRVTVTASGDLDPEARFVTGPGVPLVYTARAAVPVARQRLGDKGVVIDAGACPALRAVTDDLAVRGVRTLLVEGGSMLLRDLLAAGLADELRLAFAPFLVGNASAPRFAPPARYPYTPAAPMKLESVHQAGEMVVHRYRLSSGTASATRPCS
jgi:5-amino-6-(5-phosphoribosylamino)uracil reductase